MLDRMPQINVRVPDAVLAALREHRFEQRYDSQQKAHVDLLVDSLERNGRLTKEQADEIRRAEGIIRDRAS